jgi:[ribosomal protein S5]-alanine N-acetyltransferase
LLRPPKQIHTPRLLLRQTTPDDASAIFNTYARDEEVTRYMIWQPHKTIVDTQDFLQRCDDAWKQATGFPWAIIRKEDDALIGMFELRIMQHRAELGYVLAQSVWGQGLIPEAALQVMQWLRAQPSIYRTWAICDVENKASARVLEKIGLQLEGILHRWDIHPNISKEPRDCYCYALCK